MELDEKLFHFLWKTKKKLKKKKISDRACVLQDQKLRLGNIACAFFGKTVLIKEAEDMGGLIGQALFLPKYIDFFKCEDLNFQTYLFRILFSSICEEHGIKIHDSKMSTLHLNMISLLAYPHIKKKLIKQYPVFEELFTSLKESNVDIKKSSFSQVWQKALINDHVLNESKLPLEQKELIKYFIQTEDENLSFDSVLSLFHRHKIRLNQILKTEDEKGRIDFFPFICNVPINAQRLTIKKVKDSSIHESKDEQEKTLKKSKSKERFKAIELDEKDPDCNPASLLMEGVQTADIFSGGRKMVDGSDELDEHFEAIEELDMRELTRSSKQTQSIFKAEIAIDLDFDEFHEEEDLINSFSYDEWDYKAKKYRKDWCFLFEKKLPPAKDLALFKTHQHEILEKNKSEIQRLRLKISQILIEKRAKNRQPDGPEVDIDGLINAKADILSGHTPSPNLYISKRKIQSSLSVLLLIDSSLSADSWIEGRKVVDIAKESIIVIQDVLQGLFENIMVASFYSNTRKNCVYNIVKDFDETWNSNASKLENVKPSGYTRIGVALRHSFYHLEKVKSKKKVVLLLSDGKPTDYDAYEGKLGIADIRQCVREGNTEDIKIYSLAIDKESRFYFPQLFGAKNYEVLSSSKNLPEQLIKLLSQVI